MTATIDAIAKAGSNWSIEVTPPGAAKIDDFSAILAEGTTVNVTFLPGTDPVDTIDVAKRLRDAGLVPVPHIAARSLTSKEQLADLVADMTSRANVDEVLVIGGGVTNPVGEFASTMEVLETGILQKAGIRKIGVSGHPEGSPDINDNQLAEALAWKNDYAKKEGLELYIETQFCFDADAVVAWEKR
ncbi:metFprotein, partial [Alphaproteobacteria bacterium]|nr:metFprotein [Alphaproteobacteria bacterium]